MTINKIRRDLNRLDPEQLQAVAGFIDLLLATDEPDEPDEPESQGKENGAGGWVEHKLIRGYGPYAYWRWREGGRLRSKYLGKVKPESA